MTTWTIIAVVAWAVVLIYIAAIVVWRVVETAEAVFRVDDYEHFVKVQTESAVRNLATTFPYDAHEEGELSLRGSATEVSHRLKHEIQERLADALAGENTPLMNMELMLHVDQVKCFPDGRVVVRICRLGALPEIIDLLREVPMDASASLSSASEHFGSDIRPGVPRRRWSWRCATRRGPMPRSRSACCASAPRYARACSPAA